MPYADILCYCLMPNHFHIILTVNKDGIKCFENKRIDELQRLTKSISTLLSSYTQALNKQIGRKGRLFSHVTKAKMLNDERNDYAINCFMYSTKSYLGRFGRKN